MAAGPGYCRRHSVTDLARCKNIFIYPRKLEIPLSLSLSLSLSDARKIYGSYTYIYD